MHYHSGSIEVIGLGYGLAYWISLENTYSGEAGPQHVSFIIILKHSEDGNSRKNHNTR